MPETQNFMHLFTKLLLLEDVQHFCGHFLLIFALVKSFIFGIKNAILSKMRFRTHYHKQKFEAKSSTKKIANPKKTTSINREQSFGIL